MQPVVRIPRFVLAAAACLALAALVACSNAPRPVRPPAPAPVTAEALKRMAQDPAAKRVVLINVWATWCAPCREELPDLVRLRREWNDKGVDVVLVSADFDKPTEQLVAFLVENGVDFPTYLKAEKDADFMKAMEPDWSGAIPATFLYSGGQLVDFWEGMGTYEAFARKVKEALAAAPPSAG